MKNLFKYILIALFGIWFATTSQAQDNRTTTTKIADILAQFPAKDMTYSDKLIQEIIDLGEEGITGFCNMIIPPGTGDDTQARFAVESLAVYSGAPGREQARQLVTTTLLKALDKADDQEVKAFFIRRLQFCGSDESVTPLAVLMNDNKLFSPSLSVLTTIGTVKAASEILAQLNNASAEKQIALVKALGVLKYKEAVPSLIALAQTQGETKNQALAALAEIGDEQAVQTFVSAAKVSAYMPDEYNTMHSFLQFTSQLAKNGQKATAKKMCSTVLKYCKTTDQLRFRTAAVNILCTYFKNEASSLLAKEVKNGDNKYRCTVIRNIADILSDNELAQVIADLKKMPAETKVQLIPAIAKRNESIVLSKCILPSLDDASSDVRIAAISALALNQKEKAVPVLLKQLDKASQKEELAAVKKALFQTCSKESCPLVAEKLNQSEGDKAVILLETIAARRATDYFGKAAELCSSGNKELKTAAFQSLKMMAIPEKLNELLDILKNAEGKEEIAATQQAIVAVLQTGNAKQNMILQQINTPGMKTKLLPVLPFLVDPKAFSTVTGIIENGTKEEKQAAYEALLNWKSPEAIPYLFSILENGEFASSRENTFNVYLQQVLQSDFPDDQKLLLVRKLVPVCENNKEKSQLIQSAGTIKTFLSLVFVADFLDNEELSKPAAAAAMKIMLPTPGEDNGLQGAFVRSVAEKVMEKISGPDSQYFKIDIREFLEKMPAGEGFMSIFNGNDLGGWQGLVGNPISRAKMTEAELAKKQAEADQKMLENWSVKDGAIVFNGKGANLCTKKLYGDFEMIVDWRITKDGDSGIYLRGSPQVQIWDIARVDVGAQVGSGGLYNNQKNQSKPPVVADNPVGEWNTFRIRMVGEKVDVYLNGILVVDNVTLENYWDRSIPIFPKEAIELQAHGTDLAFRNIFVREINSDEAELSSQEKAEGFQLLFNGKNLDGWVGNKTDYIVENGLIAVRPVDHGHGNLYTEKEYSNFVFRFEFKLTPGANNGLGIHAPLEGDAAYVGKELQILDNTAAIYANLKPYQYHGSVYGTIPAKRGFLKPVGEWNYEEVTVAGDDFKIVLNGEVILEGNVKEASKDGTPDHKDHPGLLRHTGHIGFLGHGSELWFRNIRIKEL